MSKVLVVDDERVVCQLIANYLKKFGLKVFTAFDGNQALQLIDQEKPELVLLDIAMPIGMDGIQVLRELHKRKVSVKVIMVSGFLTDEFINEAKALGAIDFLHKPVKREVLKDVVLSHLKK